MKETGMNRKLKPVIAALVYIVFVPFWNENVVINLIVIAAFTGFFYYLRRAWKGPNEKSKSNSSKR